MTESTESESSQIDGLLMIPTRGRLIPDLQSLGTESSRDRPLSVLLIDLDQFKQVNDLYGHEAGDEVLRALASKIRTICERKGQPYRYGGDEIVVLLPNHSIREAASVGERIRENALQIKFDRYPEKITTSIGVASYPEPTGELHALLTSADAAMYAAKDQGGNAIRGATTKGSDGATLADHSVRIVRSDIASKVESAELWMTLEQAHRIHYGILLENDNDEDVIVEGVSLRKGTLYLCRFDKPKSGEWVVQAHSRKRISGEFQSDPVTTLITKDPSLTVGTIEIDVVVRARILGRLRTLSHTILATVDHVNHIVTQYSP